MERSLRSGKLSESFGDLLQLARSFEAIPEAPGARRQLAKLALALGSTALPLLVRMLRSGAPAQADWAAHLVAQAGPARALAALKEMSDDESLADERRVRALSLLGELGAPARTTIRTLRGSPPSLESTARRIEGVSEPADAAAIADELVTFTEPAGLPPLCQRLAAIAGAAMAPILDELAARDDLAVPARRHLTELRGRLGPAPVLPIHHGAIYAGAVRGGTVIMALARAGAGRRARALVIELDAEGDLVRAQYQEGGAAAELRVRGVRRTTVRAVAARVAVAARRARAAGDRLPRAFYLGRDLLGLVDEHMTPPAPAGAGRLLERGTALLDAGDPAAARPLLLAYVGVEPQDAEARTWLAGALMALGDRDAAHVQLVAAARLEPEDGLRHWNLAAAARQLGLGGEAYVALGEFLRRSRAGRAPARRRAARRYRRAYEQMIAREHPGARARDVALLEDIFACACDQLDSGRPRDAVRGFERVLAIVPSHHPSWSNLGAAYAQLDRPSEARRCLEKALAYRPDYETAASNLKALDRL